MLLVIAISGTELLLLFSPSCLSCQSCLVLVLEWNSEFQQRLGKRSSKHMQTQSHPCFLKPIPQLFLSPLVPWHSGIVNISARYANYQRHSTYLHNLKQQAFAADDDDNRFVWYEPGFGHSAPAFHGPCNMYWTNSSCGIARIYWENGNFPVTATLPVSVAHFGSLFVSKVLAECLRMLLNRWNANSRPYSSHRRCRPSAVCSSTQQPALTVK